MERKEELWRRIKMEICPLRDICKAKRSATDTCALFQQGVGGVDYIQDQQVASPTFFRQLSTKTQVSDGEQLTFSFGQNYLQQIENMLKQESNQKQEGQLHPICIECESFWLRKSQKILNDDNVGCFMQKLRTFISDFKFILENIKFAFKKYGDQFQHQNIVWKNCIDLMISNIESKNNEKNTELQNKIQQLTHQNYFYRQKINHFEKKALCLENQLSEIIHCTSSEKSEKLVLQKKIADLQNELEEKIRHVYLLTEENITLNTNLKKIMNLASSLHFSSNLNQSIVVPYGVEKSKILKDNTNVNFSMSYEKSKIKEVNRIKGKKDNSFCSKEKDYFQEINDSVEFRLGSSNQDYLSSPIIQRYSRTNSKNLDESPILQKQKKVLENTRVLERSKSKNQQILSVSKLKRISTTATISTRKLSWNASKLEVEIKDKNQILERIQKLKNDINTEIKDLQKSG